MKESNTPELKLPEDPLMDEVAQETKPAARKLEVEAQDTVREGNCHRAGDAWQGKN